MQLIFARINELAYPFKRLFQADFAHIQHQVIQKTYGIAIQMIKIDLLVRCEKQECMNRDNSDNNISITNHPSEYSLVYHFAD